MDKTALNVPKNLILMKHDIFELLKTNYRPISVLCIFSKIFEKILEQQLSDFFENIFNPYLCAFRRGHG
jgi:retron-type reverse transcriptase